MLKAVFFDFDGVLALDPDGLRVIARRLARSVGMDEAVFFELYAPLAVPLLKEGRHADILPALSEAAGVAIDRTTSDEALREIRKNDDMFALARELRPMCAVGIITDNVDDRMEMIERDVVLQQEFDPIVVSSRVGSTKRDGTTAIFDVALRAVRCRPEEALFIDNTLVNLEVPRSMGMRTFLHDDHLQDARDVRAYLRELAKEAS